jgi:TonB-linked SusC/RagA family outer membrane protein
MRKMKTQISGALWALLITLLFAVSAKAAGPEYISLRLRNVTLIKALQEVKKQSDVKFIYSDKELQRARPVTVERANISVEKALSLIFRNQPFTYSLSGKDIYVIKPLSRSTKRKDAKVLTGKIVDSQTGDPLIGATVYDSKSRAGGITGADGTFSIAVPNECSNLEVSYVGYNKQHVNVNDEALVILMDEMMQNLDDVVVIGYGTKNQKSLTSSISSMDKKEMETLSATTSTVDNLLSGTIKGVQTIQPSGDPGGAVKINVRGTTSPYPDLLSGRDSNVPLFVIDGMPMFVDNATLNPLLNIAPTDIESIDVLKDAAATAIYGSRGANGVIIVKTKNGKKGEKVSVEAGYTLSFSNPLKQYDPLTTTEFKDFTDKVLRRTATALNEGWVMIFDPEYLSRYGKFTVDTDPDTWMSTYTYNGLDDSKYGSVSTNWLKEIQNKNAATHQYNLSVRGGSEKTNYAFSFNGLNQEGTFINDKMERYSGRISMDTEITDWLSFGSMLNYSYSKRKNGLTGAEAYMPSDGPWVMRPDVSVYDADGNYNLIDYTGATMGMSEGTEYYMPNPVESMMTRKSAYTNNQFIGNAYMDLKLMKGLKLHADINLTRYNYKYSSFDPKRLSMLTLFYGEVEGGNNSTLSTSNSTSTNSSINFRADYRFNIDRHSFTAMAGYGSDRTWEENESFAYQGFPNDKALTNQGSANKVTSHSDSKLRTGLNSLYSRITYDYDSRYLAEVSMRGDESSKFGTDNRWGFFPAISLGWRVNNEKFLKDSKTVNDLKLRLSWGKSGSTNIPDFAYKQFYIGGSNYADGSAVTLKNMLPNKKIKWEMTSEYNFGVDFGLFDNRLSGSLDLYYRSTKGALAPAPYNLESGFSTFYDNIIDTSNKGIEFNVSGDIIRTKDFTWNASLNISSNKSKLVKLNSANISTYIQSYFIEGKAIGSSLGYKTAGIFQSADEIAKLDEQAQANGFDYYQQSSTVGDVKVVDTNGDGTITSADRVVVANPEPKFFGGLSNTFTYKDFSLFFLFQFRYGGQANYENLSQAPMTYVGNSILRKYYEGMWTPENPGGKYPQIVAGYNMNGYYNTVSSDLYVFKTSYLKLKNIMLSYNIPSTLTKKWGLENASVFVSASNLFCVTNWPGLDPEMIGYVTSTMGSSTDAYPMSRTFSFGMKFRF